MSLLTSPQKARVIAHYAKAYPEHRTFVETGTGYGVLVNALALTFDRIFSIELDAHIAEQARVRCDGWDNITVLTGDSATVIGPVIWHNPTVFFLDAHHNDEPGEGALAAELDAIAALPPLHVILVDDVRLCRDRHGWVSVETLERWADRQGYTGWEIADDIARITP
jgi:hypothetical protein